MITPQAYARALYDAISETNPKDYDKVLDNLVKILAQNGHLGMYDQVEKHFIEISNQKAGILTAEVSTANPYAQDSMLIEKLNEVVRGNVQIKHKIDQNLIGGIVVRAGDVLIDGSVRSQLQNLREDLKGD